LEIWTYPEYKYQIIDIYHSMNFKGTNGGIKVYYSMKKNRLVRKEEESFKDWTERVSATFEFEKIKMEKADQKRKEVNNKRLLYYSELKKVTGE
jgi:isocitrate dehydrogenase